MPSRELSYRVSIDTGTARREAQNVKRAIEAELRGINAGNIGTNVTRTAGSAAGQQAQLLSQTMSGLNQVLGVFGIAIGGQQVARFAIDLAKLNTEAARTQKAFDLLSGGSYQAAQNVEAIQRASGGTVSSLDALRIGNQAAALSLASTASEFERVTRAGRTVALISPVINDVSSAISELGLASANLSFRRLDQLGLSVGEVRDRMRELQDANNNLSDSQAFLEASIAALEAKGKDLLDSAEAQASGIERLGVAIDEARREAAEGPISVVIQTIAGGAGDLLSNELAAGDAVEQMAQNRVRAYEIAEKGIKDADTAQKAYADSITDTINLWQAGELGAADYNFRINSLLEGLDAYNATLEETKNKEDELANARAASIAEAQQPINDALLKRATESADIIGVDAALATLKEQKSIVDAAITELLDSAITDPDELNIRLAELQDNVLGFFDQLEERAQSVDINFGDLALSSDQFNVDFVDFLPGMDELRDRLIDLQSELAFTGSITAEQAAELEYLQAAASAASGEAAVLTEYTNALGIELLSTNEAAAAVVDQMYLATTAYLNGSITAEQYAGVMSALGGQMLQYTGEVGVATQATYALIAAQQGLAGTSGFEAGQVRGTAIANRIDTQQQEAQRRQARIDAERAARDAQRAQDKAARDAQRAWEKAARETQKAFEEAARQLESDLKNVPGLFSPTSVTEQDMQFSEAGIYTDQADEYLRRLRDEVLNGTDWADVSIEDAKQSLRELGINVADDNKIALQQFEQAWANSALFADAENIAKYINDEAVQAALDLQEKARQGQQNILEHFGVVVDEAVDAAITGAGGSYSGTGGVATVPVKAELIPSNGDFTTMPTLGGVSPVIDVAAIQGQIDALDTVVTLTPKVNEGAFALLIAGIKSTPIDIVAELDTTTLTTQLSQVGQQTGTINVSANLDTTKLVTDLSKISQQKGTVEIAVVAAGDNPALDFFTALDTQFKQASNFFYLIGQDTATQIRAGVAAGFAIQSPDGKEVDTGLIDYLVQRIGAEAVERQPRFTAAGAGIADFVLEGARNQFSPVADDGSVKSALATGMLDSMTQGIRANASNFQQRGQSVAEYVKAGFLNQFASETFKANIEAAGGLMAGYLKQGILSNLNGIADTIATKVIDDIATSVEAAE